MTLCARVCLVAQLRGFVVLVEKDWCSFGFMFHRRLGHGSLQSGEDQRSPIFLQWLDCVWQVWRQYPLSFEFNENFLATVAHHSYSCRFGTFLYNCERHRRQAFLATRTVRQGGRLAAAVCVLVVDLNCLTPRTLFFSGVIVDLCSSGRIQHAEPTLSVTCWHATAKCTLVQPQTVALPLSVQIAVCLGVVPREG